MNTTGETIPFSTFAFIESDEKLPHPELLPLADILAEVALGGHSVQSVVAQSNGVNEHGAVKARLHRALAAEAAAGRLNYVSAVD